MTSLGMDKSVVSSYMVFHYVRFHFGIPKTHIKLMLRYPRGPVLVLYGAASFHSNVHGPRCSGAVCSNGVQPCMEISTLTMMRPSCCFVASRGQEPRRDRKQSCSNVMRREVGSVRRSVDLLQKTVFRSSVRDRFKGFSGEFKEFLELVGLKSGKEGRCFHHTRGSMVLHQKVMCL